MKPAAASAPTQASALSGIALMAFGFFCYAISDMMAKLLTQSLPPLEVSWIRQLGLFSGVIVLLARRGPGLLRTRHPVLQFARGASAAIASAGFVIAITFVPLADATAVSFVAPFMVTILAAVILHEKVGIHRWMAVAVGLFGTLIIVRPGSGILHPAIIFVVIAAAGFAGRQILSRFLSSSEQLATTVAWTGLTTTFLLTLPLPWIWVTPDTPRVLLLALGTAMAAGIAELALMRALDRTQAVILAPMQYTIIIWSTFWGFVVFGQFPDACTLAGAALIIASGAYVFWREARAARRHRASRNAT